MALEEAFKETLVRVMTYNVHGCRGRDNKVRPERIAAVIAEQNPDVVALQELDINQGRSGWEDQPARIAEMLNMRHQFYPSIRIEEGEYGNAVLSRLPMEVVAASRFTPGKRTYTVITRPFWNPVNEPRGIIWVRVETERIPLQFVTTHLGLRAKERLDQAEEILGERWLLDKRCTGPVVFCGDMNAVPSSVVHRRFRRHLLDAHMVGPDAPRPTFMSCFPLLRLDHIFVSRDVRVARVKVPRSRLEVEASDHLPVVADVVLEDRCSLTPLEMAEKRR